MFKTKSRKKSYGHSETEDSPGTSGDYSVTTDVSTASSANAEPQRAINATNQSVNDPQGVKKLPDTAAAPGTIKKDTKQLKDREKRTRPDEDRRKRKEKERKEDTKSPVQEDAKSRVQGDVEENIEVNNELELLKLNFCDETETYKNFPASFYENYSSLRNFARILNVVLRFPEVVLIGPRSHGKSTLLEALVRRRFNFINFNGATKRPIYFRMVNNPAYEEEPLVTLRHDSSLPNVNQDMHLTLNELPSELEKRMVWTQEPIVIIYEHKCVMNVTYIDTPGIPPTESPDYKAVCSTILNIAKSPERIIICVEEVADFSRLRMTEFMRQIDPDLKRTILVYTKLHSYLTTCTSVQSLNSYLWGATLNNRLFFLTLLNSKLYRSLTDEDYLLMLRKIHGRDMNDLDILQFDYRFKSNIGIQALANHVRNLIWNSFRDIIPELLHALKTQKEDIQQQIADFQVQMSMLNVKELRQVANKYSFDFLQAVDQLIVGTSEGIPGVNGQTLEEEKAALGDFEWIDAYNHIVHLDPVAQSIPFRNAHVYGGQQFERLLNEFKAVCDQIDISEISMDEVATAASINKVSNMPNYAWAASDLAYHQSKETFLPLISQLRRRAVYVLRRLHGIAEGMLYDKRGGSKQLMDTHSKISDIDQYPHFKNQLKDLFYRFIEQCSKDCQEHCLSEFYCSKTIFWEFTEFSDNKILIDRTEMSSEELKNTVFKLASQLFKNVRERVTKNVMLKFYNFMLVPVQKQLWKYVQAAINDIADEQLEQYFRLDTMKTGFEEEQAELEKKLEVLARQEDELSNLSKQFFLSYSLLCRTSVM
ncbi:dynamin-like protein A [Schistocerca gregaria]|uniref:dynamin-like protein A n=1 Tax=Schistocerca gregaria TaxID=7010 RepID=UPI00211EAE71|nr:dynamin-like protein A [Schistocerca gregaria]